MADGGQGFLKLCLTVFPNDYDHSNDSTYRKRSLYSDGGMSGKTQNLTGVNKLIMLCCVPDIKES